jgi:hypothetical protein
MPLLMQLAIESIIVGIYLLCWFLFFYSWVPSSLACYFLTGFAKHFFGFWFRLQDLYCQRGAACQGVNTTILKYAHYDNMLLLQDSFLEGCMVMGFMYVAMLAFSSGNLWLVVFGCGVVLHLVAEKMGLHEQFCRNQCSYISNSSFLPPS